MNNYPNAPTNVLILGLLICLWILLSNSLMISVLSAEDINSPELRSETEENGYTIRKYLYPFSRDCDEYGYQFQITQDSVVLIESRIWPFMEMWNFCYNGRQNSPECHLKDINGDMINEIIFNYSSGGNNGAEDLEIYSIDSKAKKIAFFNGLDKGCGLYWFNDLDNDTIPEICTYSRHYECWKVCCAGSRAPLLVWKWDVNEYRIANWKLSDGLFKIKNKNGLDAVVDQYSTGNERVRPGDYFPEDYEKYPLWLLGVMLDLIYSGEATRADSVFNICWPDSIPYKDKFYFEIMNRIKADPFWPEIENSNW